jgi:phenylacetate-CoA ligase
LWDFLVFCMSSKYVNLVFMKYFDYPNNFEDELNYLKKVDCKNLSDKAENKILKLTNEVILNVPAYRAMLQSNKISLDEVSSIKDFKGLPKISKKNYVNKYTLEQLIFKNSIAEITTISATSGSTGAPTYFPRGEEQDTQYEYIAEMFLRNQFNAHEKRTLCILGFALGIWIGGIFTYKVLNKIASKGYPLSIAPVGTDKNAFISVLKEFGDKFDQVILMGYPPFIKDIVDEIPNNKIDLNKVELKIITATEAYTEKFRDYLVQKANIKNKYLDILNIYGTVELGTMAFESPLSILIRNLAVKDKKLFQLLFKGANQVPTLAQYHPELIYFEEEAGELYGTGYASSYPLIRYQFFDRGGVYLFEDIIELIQDFGIDILKEAKRCGISNTILKLPFVYVYERSDFVLSLHGANIYPENIKNALLAKEIQEYVTGKFCYFKKQDSHNNDQLIIHVELKNNVEKISTLEKTISETILKTLCKENAEFYNSYKAASNSIAPKIILNKFEDKEFFELKIKQKWSINT